MPPCPSSDILSALTLSKNPSPLLPNPPASARNYPLHVLSHKNAIAIMRSAQVHTAKHQKTMHFAIALRPAHTQSQW